MNPLERRHAMRVLVGVKKLGECTVRGLTMRLGLNMGTVIKRLEELERAGLIERKIEDKFPFRNLIKLTSKGMLVADLTEKILELLEVDQK